MIEVTKLTRHWLLCMKRYAHSFPVKATLCSSNFPAVAISAPSGKTKQLFLFCLLRQLTAGLPRRLWSSEVLDRVAAVLGESLKLLPGCGRVSLSRPWPAIQLAGKTSLYLAVVAKLTMYFLLHNLANKYIHIRIVKRCKHTFLRLPNFHKNPNPGTILRYPWVWSIFFISWRISAF